MPNNDAFRTLLASFSTVTAKLSSEDLQEAAAMGSLVDWELVKLMSRADWELVRLSFTWKDDEVLMVLKVNVNEIPYVVFVSKESPTGCMRTLLRKFEEKTVALYPDKYA